MVVISLCILCNAYRHIRYYVYLKNFIILLLYLQIKFLLLHLQIKVLLLNLQIKIILLIYKIYIFHIIIIILYIIIIFIIERLNSGTVDFKNHF